ncbi:MAG: nucleotidyltransferase domain-containing protein [Candidatus Rifleibacteriota bacterium]
MFDIEPFLPKIKEICKKYEAKSLMLFGSALTEEFDPQKSDLDFLLELYGFRKGLKRYLAIKLELENLLHKEVDLVMPEAIENPYLKKSIFSRVKSCYES